MSALEWGCPPEPLVEVLAAIDACTATTDLVVRLGLEQAAQREERRLVTEAIITGSTDHPPGGGDLWGDLDARTERLSQELQGHLDTWDGGW